VNQILAIAALTILIVALSLMALRYFQKRQSKGLVSNLEPALAPAGDNEAAHSSIAVPFDAIYWAQMNDWHVKEQADDRRPMFGKIAGSAGGSASAHRADVRRSLQMMYKKWSESGRD
jgi:hypothetical protein